MISKKLLKPLASALAVGSLLLAVSPVSAAITPAARHRGSARLDSAGLPKPEIRNISVGWGVAPTSHAIDIARYLNLFKKYGLNVTIHNFTSDTTIIDALVSGQIQIALNTGTGALLASQTTSTPLESVFVSQENITDNLYSQHNIKTAKQLIGHSIAVSSFASVSYGEAIIALKELHLQPSQVTITAIGDGSERRAALLAGSVGASINGAPNAPTLKKAGMNILVPLSTLKSADFPAGNVAVTKKFAKRAPNTILAVVAALTEGTHLFLTNPKLAIKAGVAEEGLTHAASVAEVNSDEVGWRPYNGYVKPADFQEQRIIFLKSDPQLAKVNAANAFTDKFVNELKTLGWDKKMGIRP